MLGFHRSALQPRFLAFTHIGTVSGHIVLRYAPDTRQQRLTITKPTQDNYPDRKGKLTRRPHQQPN